jgi:MFS transporter, PAT family, beta-lactamase induction signal transducer AmpG
LNPPAKPSLFQALGNKRMGAILLLGFSSGLPLNLSGSTLQAWLASVDLDIKTIGIFSLAGLPYVLKFLWAPLLDRYLPPLLGRRRGWIAIYQLCLAICIGVMAFNDPARAPLLIGMVALVLAFFSASQDIVIDAYRADVVRPQERALASAATSFGYRTAAMFAGALIVYFAEIIGWRNAYLMVAVIMAFMIIATFRAPEPETPGSPPRTLADAVVLPLRELLGRKGAWGFVLLVLLYKFGDAFALSLYSAFMVKGVGFTLAELSVGKVSMTIATMIGTALGGWIYLRLGLFRCLLIFGIGQAFTNLFYMWLALAGKKVWLLILATSVDNLAGGMGLAAFVAFLMSQCSPNYSATQYALLSALAAVPRVFLGWAAGHVVSIIGWPRFFVLTFSCAAPGLILLIILRKRINAIET